MTSERGSFFFVFFFIFFDFLSNSVTSMWTNENAKQRGAGGRYFWTTTATPKQFLSINAKWTACQKKKEMFTLLLSKYVSLSFGASASRGNVECSVEKRPDNLRCRKGTRRRRSLADGRATERTIERMCMIGIVLALLFV